jgi:hypothetical protein
VLRDIFGTKKESATKSGEYCIARTFAALVSNEYYGVIKSRRMRWKNS